MSLSKRLKTTFLVGLVSLSALFTGCAKKIGATDSDSSLKGTTTEETLTHSGTPVKRLHLDGKNLQPNTSYTFNNVSLTIDGDVPAGASITGDGQIIVTGNVGDNAELDAEVPYYSHQESYTYLMPVMCGKSTILIPTKGYKTIVDGPQPPYDEDPVIVIEGRIGKDVSLSSTKGTFTDIKP